MGHVKTEIIVVSLIVAIATIYAQGIEAETSAVRIYFDADYTISGAECPLDPPFTNIDTLYVVAENFSDPIIKIEYALRFIPQLLWLGDSFVSGTTTGKTHIGIIHTWAAPQDASGKLLLAKCIVGWVCVGCQGNESTSYCVDSHPYTGYLRDTRASDLMWIYPMSLGAMICGCGSNEPVSCTVTVPVEDASWGQIKSMYEH